MMPARPIRIGVTGPFSGPRRAYGDMIKDVVAEAGNGCEIIFADDMATPTQAVTVADYFIRAKVEAVIGHFNSDCARKAGPLYRKAGIAFIMPASTAPDLVNVTGGIRICPSDTKQIAAMSRWLADNRFQPCVEQDGTPYAARLAALLRAAVASGPQPIKQAHPVRVVLGTHVAVAATIRAASHDDEVFLVPDDCAVAEFDELLAEEPNKAVFVARPHPDFSRSTAIAFELIKSAWSEGCTSGADLMSNLLASGKVTDGEYDAGDFSIVPLAHQANSPVAQPIQSTVRLAP